MITIRPAAAQEFKRLIAKQSGNQAQALVRLQLVQGSCAEWTYILNLDSSSQPEDMIFDCGDISLAVSGPSLPYLQDLTIDYSEDLMGGGFRFINPQASQTCGCGNSFSLSPGTNALTPRRLHD